MVPREKIFKHMSDGAVVLDVAGRIVDANPAAEAFLARTGNALAKDAQTALARCFALAGELDLGPGARHLLATREQPPRFFDLCITKIDDQADLRVLIWRDVTQLQAALAAICAQDNLIAIRTHAAAELPHPVEHMVEVRAGFPGEPLPSAPVTLHGRRVLLAVEYPLTRAGLCALLLETGMYVDAAEPSCTALLAAAPGLPPDLVLLDIDLPGVETTTMIDQIRTAWPAARIVILAEAQHPNLPAAFHNGADGYALKTLPTGAFFDTLAQILNGQSGLTAGMTAQVLSEFRHQDDGLPTPKSLTPRQREILRLIDEGLTYAEIGALLHLSARTVRYHVEGIRHRLGLANRHEVAIYARRHHLAEA